MRIHTLLALAALVAAALAWSPSPAAAGPLRDDGPSVNRVKIVNLLAEARKLAAEAAILRQEAIEGRIPDRTKPREDGPQWIELKDSERLTRFAQAKTKFAEAFSKAAEAEEFLKQHPGVALEEAPATVRQKMAEQCANTIVAETRFRMSKEIGAIADWKKLAAQALKIDKDNAEATRLVEDLKKLEEEKKQEAREKAEADKKAAEEEKKADSSGDKQP